MRRLLLPLAVVIAITGCSDRHGMPFRPIAPVTPRITVAHTPQQVVTVLRDAWSSRDTTGYGALFTNDYEFWVIDVEHADEPPSHRDDEITVARHLFVTGTASEPRAQRIDLAFDSILIAIPDQRPGKTAPYHQVIATRAVLKADLGNAIWYVDGDERFYVVRGDSANVPAGAPRDSTRWYLDRWEDGSAMLPGVRMSDGRVRPLETQPGTRHTWSQLKSLYR